MKRKKKSCSLTSHCWWMIKVTHHPSTHVLYCTSLLKRSYIGAAFVSTEQQGRFKLVSLIFFPAIISYEGSWGSDYHPIWRQLTPIKIFKCSGYCSSHVSSCSGSHFILRVSHFHQLILRFFFENCSCLIAKWLCIFITMVISTFLYHNIILYIS